MPKVNQNENLIAIDPPIQWDEIKNGPELSALEMVFDSGAVATSVATGIRAVSGARIDSYLDRELQKVVNHYSGHTFSGRIEIRNERPQCTLAERVLVRGRHVVRVEAVLGWPSEPDTDPAEESLMDILASVGDGGAYVNLCAGDFDRPTMRPADETDLPDLLLAWKDAAVQAAVAKESSRLNGHINELEADLERRWLNSLGDVTISAGFGTDAVSVTVHNAEWAQLESHWQLAGWIREPAAEHWAIHEADQITVAYNPEASGDPNIPLETVYLLRHAMPGTRYGDGRGAFTRFAAKRRPRRFGGEG
jgi:hypothetical protein